MIGVKPEGGHLEGEAKGTEKTPRSKAGASVNERGQLASGDWLMSFGKFGGPENFSQSGGSGPPMAGPRIRG